MMTGRILTALVLALAGGLAAIWLLPSDGWVPPPPVRPEIGRLSGSDAPPASSSLQHVLARPVFWPSRRLAEAPEEAPAPGLAENARVLGLLGSGAEGVAIVLYEDKTVRLTRGSTLAGWNFHGVEGNSAVFSRPGEEVQRIALPKKLAQELPRQSNAPPAPRLSGGPRPPAAVQPPSPRSGGPVRPDRRR